MRTSITLEAERKFVSLAVRNLTRHGGIPHFKSLLQLCTKTVHDTYYDTQSQTLSSAGTWVRLRNGAWEAKIRRGGDFLNSYFEELSGADAIAEQVRRITGGISAHDMPPPGSNETFGLLPVARFTTTRDAWLADGAFRIVRDRMDFGHEVGEVELSDVLEGTASEVEKQARMQEMDERIVEFMRRYAWAFKEGRPVGKLTAYFDMVRKRGSGRELSFHGFLLLEAD